MRIAISSSVIAAPMLRSASYVSDPNVLPDRLRPGPHPPGVLGEGGRGADPVSVGQEFEGSLEDRRRPDATEQVKHDLHLAHRDRGRADVPCLTGQLDRPQRVVESGLVLAGPDETPRERAARHRDVEPVVELDVPSQ